MPTHKCHPSQAILSCRYELLGYHFNVFLIRAIFNYFKQPDYYHILFFCFMLQCFSFSTTKLLPFWTLGFDNSFKRTCELCFSQQTAIVSHILVFKCTTPFTIFDAIPLVIKFFRTVSGCLSSMTSIPLLITTVYFFPAVTSARSSLRCVLVPMNRRKISYSNFFVVEHLLSSI